MLLNIFHIINILLWVMVIVVLLRMKSKLGNLESEVDRYEEENTKIRSVLNSMDEVDEINQIYTFKYFHHLVEREIERAERYDTKFSLLFIEAPKLTKIDVNQQASLFRNILDIIKSNIRLVDICFQNEVNFTFVIVLTETDPEQAKKISTRIYNSISNLTFEEGNVEALMGIVNYPADGTLRRNLIEKSKTCIEEAAKLSENRIVVYSEITASTS